MNMSLLSRADLVSSVMRSYRKPAAIASIPFGFSQAEPKRPENLL